MNLIGKRGLDGRNFGTLREKSGTMSADSKLIAELHQQLSSIAAQLMNGKEVVFEDQKLKIERVGSGRLRTVRVTINGRALQAIEQNREKPSHWGQLARKGHQVVQFQDVETKKYVAVVVDGEVKEYGK
jgi:hypothetical protein